MKNMGWQCPSCKACFAPFVSKCDNCTGKIKIEPWPEPYYEPFVICTCTSAGGWCPRHGWVYWPNPWGTITWTTTGTAEEDSKIYDPYTCKFVWEGGEVVGLDVPYDDLVYDPTPDDEE